MQLYLFFKSSSLEHKELSVATIQACVGDNDLWMTENKLKLNKDKTEFVIIGSQHRPKPQLDLLTSGSESVSSCDAARNIGVIIDDKLNLDKHIASICKSSFFHIRNIARIRRFLSAESTIALVHAFITCRLDNCNSLLYGLPKHLIQRLQRVQNCAAGLVLSGRRQDHITPMLKELHWLPVEQRIVFKILLFTYKALNGLAPVYLSDLLNDYTPVRDLRSSSQNLLLVPLSNLKSYRNTSAFSICAPKLWNFLPIHIKCSQSVSN